ncbi:MAG: DUF92 domain-containing protein [bacterium]
MLVRAILGVVLASSIAVAARKTRSLSTSGAAAATVVGAIAVAAGWSWGALLIIYFASSTALSHLGRATKEQRTATIVAKSGERDAVQVLANGLLFTVAAAGMLVHADIRWIALGGGSLAASAADTWATEIGTLYGGQPRSLLTWKIVPVGTSGGISLLGTLAAVAGALFVAAVAVLLGWPLVVSGYIALGGIAGAMLDSLLGDSAQARRWCETCKRETERHIHDCGAATAPRRGLQWLDNDLVNFISSAAGGLLAAMLSR